MGKRGQIEGRLRVTAELTLVRKSFLFKANRLSLFYDVRAAVIPRTAVAIQQLLVAGSSISPSRHD